MFQQRQFPSRVLLAGIVAIVLGAALPAMGQVGPIVRSDLHHDVSPAVRDMSEVHQSSSASRGGEREHE